MYSGGKKLKSQAGGRSRKVTAIRLKQAMVEAQSRGQKVQWTVHGDGVHAFCDALKLAGRTDLSCHTAVFLSPNTDVSKVLPLLKNTQFNIHDMVYKTHDDDLISKDAQSGNGARLEKGLRAMGFGRQEAAAFRVDANDNVWKKGGLLLGVGGGAMATAVLNPATMVPALGVGSVVAAATGGKALYDNSNMAKNVMAARLGSTEPAINPHLNPLLSKTQMNLKANAHYKSRGASFVSRVLGGLRSSF